MPARPRARKFEGIALDALDADAREHARLGRRLERRAAVGPAAGARVLALAVLAHDDHVEGGAELVAQRAAHAGKQASRAHVGVLVEPLADRQPEPP